MGKRYGYVRASTQDQNLDRQIDNLHSQCDELFTEKISATHKKRPEFTKLKRKLREGDTLVVLDIDRAFRSAFEALAVEQSLRERGVKFEIMSMRIDNTTPEGELMFTVMAGFAQYERRCLIRRTKQGMESARAKGKRLGRPPKLSLEQVQEAKQMLADGYDLKDIAHKFKCARQTVKSAVERL